MVSISAGEQFQKVISRGWHSPRWLICALLRMSRALAVDKHTRLWLNVWTGRRHRSGAFAEMSTGAVSS